jgi:hypothetical protein
MSAREPKRDRERTRPLDGGSLRRGANRQRRNRHQMVGAETVEEAEEEGRSDEKHVQVIVSRPRGPVRGLRAKNTEPREPKPAGLKINPLPNQNRKRNPSVMVRPD